MRESFEDRALALLEEIRDVLKQALADEAPAPEPPPACLHPEDSRTDMSAMGSRQWKCRLCDYEYPPRAPERPESSTDPGT